MSDVNTVVLVEGVSDKSAVETLAGRRGRDLAAEGVAVLAMGGATNIGAFVREYGPAGLGLRLSGLCDVGEVGDYRRHLQFAGFGADLTRDDLEKLGFFVCVADLEDELIRALGPDGVERVIDAEGDLRSFRTLQHQPAWREGDTHAQPAPLHGLWRRSQDPLLGADG